MPFITVEKFQKYSGVRDAPEMQVFFLEAAEGIVESYLGYELKLRKYLTLRNGTGTEELQLQARPIKELHKVVIDGSDVPVWRFELSNEFIYRKEGIFPQGRRNVQVVYEAGFDPAIFIPESDTFDGGEALDDTDDFIGDADATTVSPVIDGGNALMLDGRVLLPPDIASAILRIASLLQAESDGNVGLTGKSFGDSGSRTFVNYTNFEKFLMPISRWKLIRI